MVSAIFEVDSDVLNYVINYFYNYVNVGTNNYVNVV